MMPDMLKRNQITISRPSLTKVEENAVIEVIRSGNLVQGKQVDLFEQSFAEFVGVKYAVATSSGTTALHLALLAAGIGESNEVITTSFSFAASANSILYTGAKPVFVDIEKETFNINPQLIEEKITSRTKAIIPVHLFGLPANMPKIQEIAKKHNLLIIEDACQSHGATIGNQKVGSFGDLGCFSFYATKNMTCGEGGMVTTNSAKFARTIRLLRNQGMKTRYKHEFLGYNFRMTDIQASIGRVQLGKLSSLNSARIKNADYLSKLLRQIHNIDLPLTPKGYKHVFNQYVIRIRKDYKLARDEVVNTLQSKGIQSIIYYPIPIHKQKTYLKLGYKTSLPESEKAAKEVLALPIHPMVSKRDLEYIANTFKDVG